MSDIALYAFDNANIDGDKEAVIVPNTPTLINKLIANEANGIKDKINELVERVNAIDVTAYLDLDLISKGSQGGIANTADSLEVGDVVRGFAEEGVYWEAAIYLGGDPTDRANYEIVSPVKFEPQSFTAATTGVNQEFELPIGFKASLVFKSRGLLYKTSEWSQTDEFLTILISANSGNTIYVIPQ